jgi:hypothetical protein
MLGLCPNFILGGEYMKVTTKSIKRVIGTVVAATMLCTTSTGVVMADTVTTATTATASSEVITVYLNNTPLVFPDAQPQIFSNRTYVPIRQTAEYLGLQIDWNSKTETLTFTRDGMTIAHTMRSSIVYVNGEAKQFDTPSINRNNRTLMPVRMLAESIGADVEWDNTTRSVHITTSDSVDKVKVNTLVAGKSVIESGETVQITATANNYTTKVRFEDSTTGEEIAEATQYTANADGTRTFTVSYTPTNEESDPSVRQIKATPGTDSNYSTSADTVGNTALVVNADTSKKTSSSSSNKKYESDYMISCKLDDTEVDKGDYAYVTVVTTDDVDKIRISSSYGSDSNTVSKYDEDDDERTFTGKLKMTSRGNVDLYVYLAVDGEFEDVYQTLSVKVSNTGSSSSEDDLDINDVECVEDKVYKGENAHIVVTTSLAASQVVVYDDDDNKVAKETSYTSKDDDELTWDLTFEISSSSTEKFTVTASDSDGNTVDETIRIKGKTYSKSDVCALSVTQKSNSVKEGDTCRITIKTTTAVSYVEIYDDDDDLIDTIKDSSKSTNSKTFTYTLDVDDIDDIYEAVVYSSDGDKDSIRFKLIGENVEDVEINEVKVEDTTVSLDDEINITVYTNTAVTKVWVEGEDDDGETRRISKKMTKPTNEGKNELTWKLDFDPEEKGRFTYTVVAADDDDNQDTQTIRITVTK